MTKKRRDVLSDHVYVTGALDGLLSFQTELLSARAQIEAEQEPFDVIADLLQRVINQLKEASADNASVVDA